MCYADSTAHDQVESTTSALANLGEKYERLTVTQMRQRFPLLSFENDEIGVFDPTAGVLRADASVRAYQVKMAAILLHFSVFCGLTQYCVNDRTLLSVAVEC